MKNLLDAALQYLSFGVTTIPIAMDGSKAPATAAGLWRRYIKKPPTEPQVRAMFARMSGIAVLGGATSGGLEIIDFDLAECYEPWCELVDVLAPELRAKLPVVKTPGGYHVYYRCDGIEGNQKLAKSITPWKDAQGKEHTTKIETRGEGGYVIAPPSSGGVHPSGLPYKSIGAQLTKLPTITADERRVLLSAARSFNEAPTETKTERVANSTMPRGKGRAGDEFTERVSWSEILEPHGWSIVRTTPNGITHWERPGKSEGTVSATTGHTGDKLYVFSSNAAPFESERAYGKFSAYGHLNHKGDFKKAALELQERGFGEQKQSAPAPPPPSSKWEQLGVTDSGGTVRMEKPAPAPQQEPKRLALVQPIAITAAKLEELLDDDPAAAVRPGVFEQLLSMRDDRAEWTLIQDVLRRKKKKQDFNAAVKKFDADSKRKDAAKGWRNRLVYKESKDGVMSLDKCVMNLSLILSNDEAWAGVLKLNSFTKKIVVDQKRIPFDRPDAQWSDADAISVKIWLETHYPIRPTTNEVHEAILNVCTNNRFNPLMDYLEGLDPVGEREVLDHWLVDFFGADDTPYTRAVSARWMIGAVARAYKPGTKVDAVLILEGKQGLKKSSVLEKLCPDPSWFTDGLSDFGSKDQKEEIEGKWIVELGELKGFGKELEQIKAFVTRTAENYRPAYARHEIHSPRTCVFAGTVNPSGDGFLRDVTGNRRFWPVACTKQAPDLTPAMRDQLWAEAKARYINGEKWWIEEDEVDLLRSATEQQNARVEVDIWHDVVAAYVSGHTAVSANDILKELGLTIEKRGQRESQRIGRIMKMLGWEKYRDSGEGRPWLFRPTDEAEHRIQRKLPF